MWRFVVAVALTTATSVASASPVAEVTSDSSGVGDGCEFAGDHMSLTVHDGERLISHYPFCSSYGHARAVIEQDAKGIYYVLLWSSQGHGTRAEQKYLTVYLLKPLLDEYVRTPVAGAANANTYWEYDVRVEKPQGGGLRIMLYRRVTGGSPDGYPEPATRQVSIGLQ